MNPTKEIIHAVIVRIWFEPRELKGAETIWRSVIENVDNGERVYFMSFDQVVAYLSSMIEDMGAKATKL